MILIVVEQTDGTLKKSAFELVTAAAALAPSFQDSTAGLVLGPGSTAAANALADYLPEVVHLDAPELSSMPAEAVTTAVVEVARLHGAEVVLFAATRAGLSVSPRVAARMDVPLLEDVLDLEVHDGLVVARRFSYLSRITETVQANSRPIVGSVKPGTFQAAEPAQPGTVEAASVVFSTEDTRVTVGEKTVAATGRVSLVEARVVVTGGRGVGSTDGFEQLVEPLADALNAGIGATRAVVENGWRPYAEQIGQTGKTVAPDLYLAPGVSGAVQHLSGMNRSKIVAAVNKDPDAPIFQVSDYGAVGDVHEVVPLLIAALRDSKS